MGSIGWGPHVRVADASTPVLAVRDMEEAEMVKGEGTDSSACAEPCDSADLDRLLDPNYFTNDSHDFDLPPRPNEAPWVPDTSPNLWTNLMFKKLPGPVRRWIRLYEPSMRCTWETMFREKRSMLPVLQQYARNFEPRQRRAAVRHLFEKKGLLRLGLVEDPSDMFEDLFCGIPEDFGHATFLVDEDMTELKVVLSIADCFLSLIDENGFADCLRWVPLPEAADPEDFRAGGVHTRTARKHWEEMNESGPGVSKWVLSWVRDKVWFVKKGPHRVDHSASNAACLDPENVAFDAEKAEFMDRKVAEMVRAGAIIQMPEGRLPDVLTRLSLAPKPGSGDRWRVIMDMRPENRCYEKKRVRMENLAHVPAIFTGQELLFSCDLKSAYYSVGVDPRLGRTMGLQWRGRYYRFTCIPFGFSLSPWVFVKTGRQILKKWRAQGPGDWAQRWQQSRFAGAREIGGGIRCHLYMDDSLAGHRLFGAAVFMRNAMMLEFQRLGFSLSAKGELLPFPRQRFLGMCIHFGQPTPSWHLPADKLKNLLDVVTGLLDDSESGRKEIACRTAAKCVGKMISAVRAVPLSRMLFRELNWCIYEKGAPRWGGVTRLSPTAVRDLQWMVRCFGVFNRQGSPIWVSSRIEPVDRVVVQDAGPRAVGFAVHKVENLQAVAAGHLPTEGGNQLLGWGDHVRGTEPRSAPTSAESGDSLVRDPHSRRLEVAADSVAEGLSVATSCGTIELTDEECRGHHVHKELLGAYLALLSRRHELQHRRVALFVDATASVAYLAKWGGPSQVMTRIVRRIWCLCAAWDIRVVQASHISGTRMISVGVDALSRPYKFARGGEMDRDDWRLRESAFSWLQSMVWSVVGSEAVVDRMASRANRRLPRYNSVSSVDPEAESFSAFAVDWSEVNLSYCFPPFALVPRVLQHVRECQARAVVVVPDWPSQAWWRDLVSMSVAWWHFPEREVFERVSDGEWQVVTKMSFRPVVVVLDGTLTWG